MNDRAGAQGRKTKPPPVVRLAEQRPGEGRTLTWSSAPTAAGCGWGWGRRATGRPGRCPDPRPQRPPAGPRAPRGKQAAAGAAARRMQLPAAAAAATGPRDPARPSPTRQAEAATRDAARCRARPARPSAALPAALRNGLGLGLPLCWHPPSLPATPRAPRAAPRHRPPPGYAAPLARPADSVESAAAGTREAMSSARSREGTRGSGHPGEVHAELRGPGAARPRAAQQRPAPRRSLSRRRPRAARRPARVAPSRRSRRARPASLAPPPSSRPACPVPFPAPAPGPSGTKGAGRSPPASPAPLPLDAWATCARTSLQGTGLGASCTSWTRGRATGGVRGEDGRDSRPCPVGRSRGRCRRAGRVQPGEGRIPRLRRSLSCSPCATPEDMRVPRGAAEEGDPLISGRLDSSEMPPEG